MTRTTFDAEGNPVATVRVSTKYSIFREDRKNGRLISTPGSQDDDVNLTKQEFIDKYSVSNMTMPAPGFGGSGGTGAVQLAAQGSKASAAAQAMNFIFARLQNSSISFEKVLKTLSNTQV